MSNSPEVLKITAIEVFKIDVPLNIPFRIAFETIRHAQNCIIKIHCSNEICGWGESSPFKSIIGEAQESQFEIAKSLAKAILNKNPLEIENRLADLDRVITANPCIKSAFDMALYDIAAQQAQLPLYAFLGGANDRDLYTDMTIGIDTPGAMAQLALQYKTDGFPAIKIKVGTTKQEDVARVAAIRQAVGPAMALRLDANQGWTKGVAIQTLQALAAYDIEHCEAPIAKWNQEGLIAVNRESPIPIMADESLFSPTDAARLAKQGAVDYFNIKLAKSGGIRNALKITAIAEANGIRSQVGCFSETKLGITALVHLSLASKNIVHFDMDSPLMHAEDPVEGGIEYVGKGKIMVSNAIGIGASIKTSILDKAEQFIIN